MIKKMKKRNWMMMTVIAASLLLGGCTKEYKDPADSGTSASGSDASDSLEDTLFGAFESVTLDGENVDQTVFEKADLTMVNIWATYCQPCISEMPDLGELSREYEEKGVQIIGMVADVSQAPSLEAGVIVDYTKADYMHIVSSSSLLSAYLKDVQAVPTTVFVDSEGRQVGEEYTGARSKEMWAEILDTLLEEVKE